MRLRAARLLLIPGIFFFSLPAIRAEEHISPPENFPERDTLHAHSKTAALLLAFPLPLGVLGMHRIYLGTKPHVPVIYILTLGGGAGLLPLIDFILLWKAEDIEKYAGNPAVFMWNESRAGAQSGVKE